MLRRSATLLCLVFTALIVSIANAQPASNMIGMLGVGFRDFQDGSHEIDYTLYTFDGAAVPLKIPGDVLRDAGGFYAIQDTPVQIVLGLPTRDGRMTAAAIHAVAGPRWYSADPIGSIEWKYLLCKFNDVAATPISNANMQTMVGNSASGIGGYWSETSHGVSSTSAQVYNWTNIGHNQNHYTSMNDDAARIAYVIDCAAAHGVILGASYNVAIGLNGQMFSTNYAYGSWNFGGGALQRTAFLPDWAISDHSVVAHEQGHTYGMPHSDNSDGDNTPYDNPWDVMSDASSFAPYCAVLYGCIATPTTAYNYRQIGMLPNERLFTMADDSMATIVIDDWMADGSSNYKAAFIPIQGSNSLYTVEVHNGTDGGYNSPYQPASAPTDAVVIYKVDPNAPTNLAKLVGGDTQANAYNMAAAWTPGETYTHEADGVTIEVLAATENGFQVRISQGNPIDGLILNTPAHNAVVTDGSVTFEWQHISAATKYILNVKRNGSTQQLKVTVSGDCLEGVCSVLPDYAALGWKWDDTATYKWWVIGKDGTNTKIAKSAKNTLTTDLLPDLISITLPIPDATLIGTSLLTTFGGDLRVGEYRVLVTRGGKTLKTAWTSQAAICVASLCTMLVDMNGFPGGAQDGVYKLKAQGRTALSVNKAQSPKQKFTFDN